MSTNTLLRSTAHPPCPQDHEVFEVTVPTDRATLPLRERLSLRIGLWLLLQTQRRTPTPPTPPTMTREDMMRLFETRSTTERESLLLLNYDMQRYLR